MIPEPAALAYLTVLVGPRLLSVLCFRVCTCLCMCRERCRGGTGTTQDNAGSLPQWLSTLIFEAGSFYWAQSRPVWVGWLAGKQQGSTCLCHSDLGLEAHIGQPVPPADSGNLLLGPHGRTAGTSLSEPSLQACVPPSSCSLQELLKTEF